ncbi:hypothetical protein GTCCBUS3UF5_20500 [Geobacillus thermoleovorans CCB_US3_UF5]|uniref:Uncharacterized protein n=2 Tax=Geobacillus thermoleovorans group TaxID=1505648 RepID=U2X7P3_GEOKU|nr:hypothetical protein GTCCBUS3UF5_20500 [Geobacillus thermoleovorans CCB_US3_UF5]GAD14985.1 hypothetical protein GBL_3202 [Geobacillus kaustophilus GBlys]GAJ58882.1 hypothetical protein B23_2095 [Geobacillus thermoleovorans B23]
MKFPTGGDEALGLSAREPQGRIRCESGADSIVWMGEDEGLPAFVLAHANV